MYNDRDWTKAIANLIRLTVEKKLIWEHVPSQNSARHSERLFTATKGDKTYAVSTFNIQVWEDVDEWHWETGYSFEIWKYTPVNPMQYKIATSPNLSSIANLFRTVENQVAVNEDALGFLLQGGDE